MANEPELPLDGAPPAEGAASSAITIDAIKTAGVPETYLKDGAFDIATVAKDLGELSAMRTSQAERAKLIPESADKYGFNLPETVKLPDGVSWDPKVEFSKPVAEWAHKRGLTQADLTELTGIYAQHQVAQHAASAKFYNDEMAKLGGEAKARLGTLFNSLKGAVGDEGAAEIAAALSTASGVQALEKLISLAGGPKLAANSAGANGKERPDYSEFDKNPAALHRMARQ